jgi:hypothetical protein
MQHLILMHFGYIYTHNVCSGVSESRADDGIKPILCVCGVRDQRRDNVLCYAITGVYYVSVGNVLAFKSDDDEVDGNVEKWRVLTGLGHQPKVTNHGDRVHNYE